VAGAGSVVAGFSAVVEFSLVGVVLAESAGVASAGVSLPAAGSVASPVSLMIQLFCFSIKF
jgi:hypothetical protein